METRDSMRESPESITFLLFATPLEDSMSSLHNNSYNDSLILILLLNSIGRKSTHFQEIVSSGKHSFLRTNDPNIHQFKSSNASSFTNSRLSLSSTPTPYTRFSELILPRRDSPSYGKYNTFSGLPNPIPFNNSK